MDIIETNTPPKPLSKYDQIINQAIGASKGHPGQHILVWGDLDTKEYYYDTIPVKLYRQAVVAVILDGNILKQKNIPQ